jgi:hypothetical protein
MGGVCSSVVHAMYSKNDSKDVLIVIIFHINVQPRKTARNKCQHPIVFLPLKVETHTITLQKEKLHLSLYVVKIDIKLILVVAGLKPTCSSGKEEKVNQGKN